MRTRDPLPSLISALRSCLDFLYKICRRWEVVGRRWGKDRARYQAEGKLHMDSMQVRGDDSFGILLQARTAGAQCHRAPNGTRTASYPTIVPSYYSTTVRISAF